MASLSTCHLELVVWDGSLVKFLVLLTRGEGGSHVRNIIRLKERLLDLYMCANSTLFQLVYNYYLVKIIMYVCLHP